MLTRRGFLAACSAGAMSLVSPSLRAEWLWHGCGPTTIPESLAHHEFMQRIWQGVDATKLWDCHVHLLGRGDHDSGAWINPRMDSLWHPIERLQKAFYLNAACVSDQPGIDAAYIARLLELLAAYPPGAKAMLLAFDWHYQKDGKRVEALSPFFASNDYAQRLAHRYSQRFEWIASVHPYREDAIEALEQAAMEGARALKWLPSAQGMDPADPRCDRFYETLARLRLPLLSHAGGELAVHGGEMQDYGNPLRLRRALDHGVRVIVAHCATLGKGIDLDRGPDGPEVSNFRLFARLMGEARYEKNLYGDLAAVGQRLRAGKPLRVLLQRREWHARLVYGSDYPLPGVQPIFSPHGLATDGFLTQVEAEFLVELRRYNPLLFDFALKRLLVFDGKSFDPVVFATQRIFVEGSKA